jgi:ABC-2 type transport system ATP-binding protein
MSAIEVQDLVKDYGPLRAVDNISFTVRPKEIFGLIGPNGAGKTTALRILASLLKITSGSVSIFGIDVSKKPGEIRKIISYLPEDAGAYKNLTGKDYLRFIAKFFSSRKNVKYMVEKGMTIADLKERITDKVETYSKGMTRRLLIARTLMIDPRIAILDEPTSGLDVINAQEIRGLIKTFAKNSSYETAVLLSSHNMLEVEFLCDRIALMNEGKVVETGSPEHLMKKYDARNIEEVFVQVVQ